MDQGRAQTNISDDRSWSSTEVSWHGVQDLFTRYIHDSKKKLRKNTETIWNDEQ